MSCTSGTAVLDPTALVEPRPGISGRSDVESSGDRPALPAMRYAERTYPRSGNSLSGRRHLPGRSHGSGWMKGLAKVRDAGSHTGRTSSPVGLEHKVLPCGLTSLRENLNDDN